MDAVVGSMFECPSTDRHTPKSADIYIYIYCRYGTQVLRCSGTQVLVLFRAGTQVLMYSSTQVLRYSGTSTLALRYSGTQILR